MFAAKEKIHNRESISCVLCFADDWKKIQGVFFLSILLLNLPVFQKKLSDSIQ